MNMQAATAAALITEQTIRNILYILYIIHQVAAKGKQKRAYGGGAGVKAAIIVKLSQKRKAQNS